MGAGGHLQEGPDRHDGLILRGHSLPRQIERLLGGGLDALGAVGFDVADAVKEQGDDGDDGKDHQPRADAQRELAAPGLALKPLARVGHGDCPVPPSSL
jgi:hypothetical protein